MATELAKAYVQIVPSARGMAGAISKELGGEADSAGASAGKKAGGSLVSTLKNVVVAAGIGKLLKDSLMAGADLQQSIGGIETLFGAGGRSVEEYAQKVGKSVADAQGDYDKLMAAQTAMMKNADIAYQTVGLSANDYMQNVTGFSAALISSLGGDTQKAADAANTAMIDMADNANKMGTDMQSIQNAYQGFAKQNYTMLDNLKLGYGGTKTEMQRLLADAEKISGVHYDMENLADVYSAIHVIQGELDITGTTAKEASTTFTGSFSAMKAAASNLMANISLGADLGPSLEALGETVSTFLIGNLIPMVGNILAGLPQAVSGIIQAGGNVIMDMLVQSLGLEEGAGLEGIINSFRVMLASLAAEAPAMLQETLLPMLQTGISQMMELLIAGVDILGMFLNTAIEMAPGLLTVGVQLLQSVTDGIFSAIPTLIESAGTAVGEFSATITDPNFLTGLLESGTELLNSIVDGIAENLPALGDVALDAIVDLADAIVENLPQILEKGQEILENLIRGIQSAFPQLLASIGTAIGNILRTVVQNLPQIIRSGFNLLISFIKGIGQAGPSLITGFGQLLQNIKKAVKDVNWLQVGKDIIQGLINGIGAMAGALWEAAQNIAKSALNAIKGFFGIKSPSRRMRDEVGKFLPLGIAVGIQQNAGAVRDAMDDLADEVAETDMTARVQAAVQGSPVRAAGRTQTAKAVTVAVNIGTFINNTAEDVEALADTVAERIQFRVEQQEVALA